MTQNEFDRSVDAEVRRLIEGATPQPPFRVMWEIDIEDVDTPEEAARRALAYQRDPASIATVFEVMDRSGERTTIDLTEIDG